MMTGKNQTKRIEAVLAIQPEVIARVNATLTPKAQAWAMADYHKWIIRCDGHEKTECWDSDCGGKVDETLLYDPQPDRQASIVTHVCRKCARTYTLQNYEENLSGAKSRLWGAVQSFAETIIDADAEVQHLKKQLAKAKTHVKAVQKEYAETRKIAVLMEAV